MSEQVFVYQLAILVSVIATGIVIGKIPMTAVAFGWSIWTLVMVFTRWLFLFQFMTITAAFLMGMVVQEKSNFPVIQTIVRKTLVGISSLLVIGFCVALYVESKRNKEVESLARPLPLENPAPPQTKYGTLPALDKYRTLPAPDVMPSFDAAQYEAAVTELERKYPVLDENSTVYNLAIVKQVLARKQEYFNQGLPGQAALIKAAHEVMNPSLTSHPIYWCVNKTAKTVQDFPCESVKNK